ncbi:S-adenosylmethionine--diacylglycerol 3-amino-3-carboxypropyl transferase [Bryobacterales bacterium F-183]|nr:S-adenosylmethionine--diacylglycerol 3-amino-3-carboxypropyl transferase [Bryobacterales bacterium F-183]
MTSAFAASPNLVQRMLHRAHDAMFRSVHSTSLIYNTCWEDPALDRELMELGPDSRVVMITSAGCNALDYLLDGPAEVHAVDVNPRQNALLELKMALFRLGEREELWRMFGDGVRPGFVTSVLPLLAPYLRSETYAYWLEKHAFFEPRRLRPTFYYAGAAGQVAWTILQGMARVTPSTRERITRLMDAQSLEEQRELYEAIRPVLWNAFHTWLVKQPLTMAMLGVPRPQIRLIDESFPGGVPAYLQGKMEHVMTGLPIADNYFWRVYVTGSYSRRCCPGYLKYENFATLQDRVSRIRTHDSSVTQFLRRNPGRYSHYVLLDHQDWLASHDPAALAEEWDLILANSAVGTRILMRSASPSIDFLPQAALSRLRLFPERAAETHARDRVGTYGSTLFAEVAR